jgi:hypothetical protein
MKAIGVDPNEASCHFRERLGDGTYFERRVGSLLRDGRSCLRAIEGVHVRGGNAGRT